MRKEGENKIKMKTRLNKHLSSLSELFAICYCACSICGSPYKHNLVFFFLFTFIAWDMSACLVAMPFYAHTHTHIRKYVHIHIRTHELVLSRIRPLPYCKYKLFDLLLPVASQSIRCLISVFIRFVLLALLNKKKR